MDASTAEGAAVWIKAVLEGAERLIAKDGTFTPHAYMLARRHPRTGEPLGQAEPVPIVWSNVPNELTATDKNMFAELVRRAAVQGDAVGVAFLTVALMVIGDMAMSERAQQWVREHGKLDGFPGAKWFVVVHYEHGATGPGLWLAPIVSDGAGVRLGDWEHPPKGVAGGRFSDLLPVSAYGTPGMGGNA